MKLLKKVQSLLKKVDLFSASQFLRYQEEGDYKTASGGICSLLIVIVFGVLFMSTAIDTINMDIINWTSSREFRINPVETQLTVDPIGKHFMFAVGVMGLDLNNATHRYFDLKMVETAYANLSVQTKDHSVALVPCTKQHFSVTQELKASYDQMPARKWMCPPIGYSFKLRGKYTSTLMELLQVRISKCDNALDPTRPCVPDAQIAQLQQWAGQFYYSFYYINPLINAGSKDYLNYYLQDKNFVLFTPQMGARSSAFVQDYKIQTDISLLPFTDTVTDQGVTIPDLFQSIAHQVTSNTYASFLLIKSSSSTTYLRSFNKLDTFFSYVGGLVGTILGLMLIVQSFTDMSFELSLSEKLFTYSQNPPSKDFNHFNLLTYVLFCFYEVLNFFGFCQKWQRMKQYDLCREEITKQLDIELLLHRIDFLERSIDALLSENQIYGLHLQKIDTLRRVKKRRRRYAMRSSQALSSKVINDEGQEEDQESSDEDTSSDQHSRHSKSFQNEGTLKIKEHRLSETSNIQMSENLHFSTANLAHADLVQKDKVKIKKKNDAKLRKKRAYLSQLKNQSEGGNKVSLKIISAIDSQYLSGSKDVKPIESFDFQFPFEAQKQQPEIVHVSAKKERNDF